ncbi:unnamed protein product, partial [Symbiodinium sp. CCMP2456]
PISLTADMAAVQDALWLARCKQQLEAYTDLRQLGGKMDTVLVILAVILHVQIRHYQGVDTYLLFSDIQQAFDTASHDGMLFSAYLAGVVEVEWRLLCHFLAMDTANIMLAGLLSQTLTLRAGIPQGRKFSVHVFTALLKHFGDILLFQCSPSQTLLPDFAADAISGLWAALTPAPNDALLSGLGEQPSLQQIATAVTQAPSPTETRRLAIHLLSNVRDRQQRAQCVEMMGSLALGPLLFVDDVVTPFATDRDVQHAVVHGLGAYSRFANAQFNMGPTKTAVLSCMDSPQTSLAALACESYKLLGVTVALFEELSLLMREMGLPPPVHAAAVIERVEPVVLYASELFALTPEVLPKLDALQGDWAKTILAGKAGSSLRGSLAVALLGWPLRLSSKVLLRIFSIIAKIQLLPREHPTAVMLAIAKSLPAGTWWHAVELLRHQLASVSATGALPHIADAGLCPAEMLERARGDYAVRKNLLKLYKTNTLMPIMKARDDADFQKAASKFLVGLGLDFFALGCQRRLCNWSHLLPVLRSSEWKLAKKWAFARLTGTWPLSLLSESQPLEKLECCPFCNQGDVMIRHALCECSGTAALFVQTGLALYGTRRVDGDLLLQMLFHSTVDSHIDAARIRYVDSHHG